MGAVGPLLVPSALMILVIVAFDSCDFLFWFCTRRPGGFRQQLTWLRAVWRREDGDDEVREAMAKLLSARRFQLGKIVLAVLWQCACAFCLQLAVRVLLGFDVGYEFRVVAFLMGLAILSASGRFRGTCMVERSMPILHLLLAALFFSAILWEDPAEQSQILIAMDILFMLGLCCIYLHSRLTVVTNVCMSICQLIAFLRSDRLRADEEVHQRAFAELFSLMARVTLLYVAQRLMEYSVRNEVVAQLGKCQQTAISSLLDTMCDAVVELDQGAWTASTAALSPSALGRSISAASGRARRRRCGRWPSRGSSGRRESTGGHAM
mmetsp:Transcript_22058/g.63100  ORF Transcript_22058/g.63100 Transcript_22058/m.63100 type:complete len:322 (-) Transcript_22058:410-1375(-)